MGKITLEEEGKIIVPEIISYEEFVLNNYLTCVKYVAAILGRGEAEAHDSRC